MAGQKTIMLGKTNMTKYCKLCSNKIEAFDYNVVNCSSTTSTDDDKLDFDQNKQLKLDNVFEGTKPLVENSIERLVPVFSVSERIEKSEVPKRLIFQTNGGTEAIRYINLGFLPTEVQRVISHLPSSLTLEVPFSKNELLSAAKSLVGLIEKLPENDKNVQK
jgi:hypothetical protein